jgi:hypothetical protein
VSQACRSKGEDEQGTRRREGGRKRKREGGKKRREKNKEGGREGERKGERDKKKGGKEREGEGRRLKVERKTVLSFNSLGLNISKLFGYVNFCHELIFKIIIAQIKGLFFVMQKINLK